MKDPREVSVEKKATQELSNSLTSEKGVVTKGVKVRKKNNSLVSIFKDNYDEIKDYVINDTIMPKVKDLLFETIENTAKSFIYGPGSGHISSTDHKRDYTSYSKHYSNNRSSASRVKTGYSFDNVCVKNKSDAKDILYRLEEILDEDGWVAVGHYYDFADVSTEAIDFEYGWDDLRNVRITPSRDGYILRMPVPKHIR